MLRVSMVFHLIYCDSRDDTISSNFKVALLALHIATIKVTQEFGKEHNNVINLSSLTILIPTKVI